MNGTKGTKNGSTQVKFPGIIETFKHCYGVIFLKDVSILSAYLNPAHTLNLVSIFLFMMIIPYKSTFNKNIFDIGSVIEGIILTVFFIGLLYIFLPRKKVNFLGFLRIMLAAEIIDIFNPISFLLPKSFLIYFNAGMIGWYFCIIVVVLNKLVGMPKHIGVLYVICVFFVVNMIPAMFY